MSEQIASIIPSSLVPSGVRDDRQLALTQAFGEALAKIDLSKLFMADPMTVDVRLLPFMIREFGAQDFIDPELPIEVQRRILKDIWKLKSLHGYDAGVKLGLQLLGMEAEIVHWHQTQPMGAPNTHVVRFSPRERLFEGEDPYLSEKTLRAASRMIDRTKRFSQETTVAIFVPARTTAHVGVTSTYQLKARNFAGVPPVPPVQFTARRGAISWGQLSAPTVRVERIAA